MGEVDPHIWDRFGMVAVQDYTGYQTRQPALWAELKGVGLLSRTEWFWNFPGPFPDVFARGVNTCRRTMRDTGTFDCTMGHYRIMKTALARGARSVLVFEDDVCFAKDPQLLEASLAALPGDYDIAWLEWCPKGPMPREEILSRSRDAGGGYWASAHGLVLRGAGATAFSALGMEWKVREMEKAAGRDAFGSHVLRSVDCWHEQPYMPASLRAYVSIPCLAIQRPHRSSDDPHMHAGGKNYTGFLHGGSLDMYERGGRA